MPIQKSKAKGKKKKRKKRNIKRNMQPQEKGEMNDIYLKKIIS